VYIPEARGVVSVDGPGPVRDGGGVGVEQQVLELAGVAVEADGAAAVAERAGRAGALLVVRRQREERPGGGVQPRGGACRWRHRHAVVHGAEEAVLRARARHLPRQRAAAARRRHVHRRYAYYAVVGRRQRQRRRRRFLAHHHRRRGRHHHAGGVSIVRGWRALCAFVISWL